MPQVQALPLTCCILINGMEVSSGCKFETDIKHLSVSPGLFQSLTDLLVSAEEIEQSHINVRLQLR